MTVGDRPFPRLRRRATAFFRRIPLSRRGWFVAFVVLLLLFVSPFLWRGAVTLIRVPAVMISLLSPGTPNLEHTNGRTNILLLGTAGGSHEGANLTDTVMVASIDLATNDVALFSLPRDLWIPTLNGGSRVNAAYALGEVKRKGGGLVLANAIVEEVLNLPIHFTLRIDFSAFERAIDQMGGISIDVERSFVDARYPIAGKENDPCAGDTTYSCRYETISFDKGERKMDGATALKFVRSRMGTNGEGTDFGRTRRQQEVLEAVQKKILSASILLQPGRVKGLLDTFGESIDTDIEPDKLGEFYKLARRIRESTLRAYVLEDESPDALLVNPPIQQYRGQWVLLPRVGSGKWDEIHAWVAMVLTTPSYVQLTPRPEADRPLDGVATQSATPSAK
ncbi:MAG: LCP family protein [bacterium]|nr:LCP family protein [bacterium]